MATGGPAGIYADSVYPGSQSGSTGLALRAGASLQNMTEEKLQIKGRHDPCIVQRAVPVVEAVTAITLLDIII
jgi:chorismate synthase